MDRRILYAAVPAAAFALVLANALFGHLVGVGTEQVASRYSVYVHLQPGWDSSPANLIFEVTSSWHRGPDGAAGNGGDSGSGGSGPTYNENRVLEAAGREYVELRHGFSECRDEWQPILYRRAIDAVRHEIEYLQGEQTGIDPSVSMYPNVPGDSGNGDSGGGQEPAVGPGYAQFIPVCTSAESATAYDYSARIDADGVGIDVYFVPSEGQRAAYYGDGEFAPYPAAGCSAVNMRSLSGTCGGVGPGAGLLVVVPDRLEQSVTKVTVNLYEREA